MQNAFGSRRTCTGEMQFVLDDLNALIGILVHDEAFDKIFLQRLGGPAAELGAAY